MIPDLKRYLKIRKRLFIVYHSITQKVAKLYIDTGFGFSEKQVISQTIVSDETRLEFDLSSFTWIKTLRFDPINDCCVLHINSIEIVIRDNSSYELGYFQTNATHRRGNTLVFITNHPQISLNISENAIQKVIINLEYIVIGEDSINYLVEYQDQIQMEQRREIKWRDIKIREELEHVEHLHGIVKKYAKSVQNQMEDVHKRDESIKGLHNRIKELHVQLESEKIFRDELFNSRSWTITKPLMWIFVNVMNLERKVKTALYFIFKRECKLIEESGLFDTQYYLEKYHDVKNSNVNPLVHYVKIGFREGRDPNPLFDTSYYMEQNPDVAGSGINPLAHYVEIGFREGRDPNPLFDTSYYMEQNPDVAGSGMNPLLHYMNIGVKQERDPFPLFGTSYYMEQNPDVIEKGIDPLVHYMSIGASQRRDPHPLFDSLYYLEQNPVIIESDINPLLHYIDIGAREGRDPNLFFDSSYYLRQNPDVAESGINPLIHYINDGIRDGRRHPNPLIDNIHYAPKISIITPVYNIDKSFLHKYFHSILQQTYDNWELCLVDDGSTRDDINRIIEKYSRKDCRVKVKLFEKEQGVAKALNGALSLTTGEFISFMEIGDELSNNALYEVVKILNEEKEIDFIYSDDDEITVEGVSRDPFFKPDWSPDMLRSYNYMRGFVVIRKKVVDSVDGFRPGYHGSEDYDLFLRIMEKTEKIAHIPKVLYHRRFVEDLAEEGKVEKTEKYENDKKALKDHIHKIGLYGQVVDGQLKGTYHIKYRINGFPKVCIIIPTKDRVDVLRTCIGSILRRSSYNNYSIMIVDNSSVERETFEYYNSLKDNPKISILEYDRPFNFSAINNYAVSKANSEFLVLLNNDTEVISPDWIEEMLGFGQREDVGAVGALLYYSNDTVQHAGIIIGIKGVAGHSHKYYTKDSGGYFGRLKTVQNVSAVTGACMMTKKSIFEEIGGFDENMSHAFNDVDYCLKMREKGYLVIYTPYAELHHHESLSRGYEVIEEQKERFEKEIRYFKKKWENVLDAGDPYYNPNLTIDREDFSVRDEFQYDGQNAESKRCYTLL